MILSADNPHIHSFVQLSQLLLQVQSSELKISDALSIIEQLLRHGCYERAAQLISNMFDLKHENETFNLRLEKLNALANQISLINGVSEILIDSDKVKALLSVDSCLIKGMADSGKIVIVYATAWNNFDISFPFLHHLIVSKASYIIYIKNPYRGMYGSGNYEYGNNIDEMSSNISNLVSSLDPTKVTVLGFSGGGYAALHLAAKIKANAYFGFAIKTDHSVNSLFKKNPNRTSPSEFDYQNDTFSNLRYMPEVADITRANLYFGDLDESDKEHAINMIGLRNFSIIKVKDAPHNLIVNLLERGQFNEILREILD
jgi:hypothetical protein